MEKEGIAIKLSETTEMMNSKDHKERFRAEYFQLKIRINNLTSILDNYRKGTLNFKPKCSLKLLDGQMRGMLIYKTHLEECAKLQKISLEEVVQTEETNNVEDLESTEKSAEKLEENK